MHSSLRTTLITGTLVLGAASISAKTPNEITPEPTVSIRVYDRAQVPDTVLHLATASADRLFRPAKFRIHWEQPLAESPEDRGTDMTSPAFGQPDRRTYLVVRLTRRTPAISFPGALAYSLPFAQTGAHVQIFYDRVEALSNWVNAAAYVMLGHVLAHEIAHVLLGSSEHAAGGLMTARWTTETWRLASAGVLTFRREEITGIRTGLSRFQSPEPTRNRQLMLALTTAGSR